jgi:hypothetical protein
MEYGNFVDLNLSKPNYPEFIQANTLKFLTKFPKKITRLILSTWLENIQAKGKVMGILS